MSKEQLTEKEVEAIIKRYGEAQTGAGQTSVEDVAEALQVEPHVVERLLHEVRTAETSQQLQDRLSTLERENEQLRKRASHWQGDDLSVSGFESWPFYRPHRKRRMMAIMVAMLFAGFIVALSTRVVSSGMMWMLIGAGVFFVMRHLRGKSAR